MGYNINMTTTKQEEQRRDEKGRIIGGTPPVGFHTNPERRSDGRWKKEDSISYNYNKFLAMSEEEFAEFKPQTKAQRIAYNRIKDAEDSLNDTKEITDRVEGKAPQSIDMTSNGESISTPVVRIIDERTKD